ncbi:MAG: thioredoxin domain-containing protein, partial [Cyclobacteriaceae bacterium]
DNPDNTYEEVIRHTVEWLKRDMAAPDGGFYSALDADSEGEEGKYYVWSLREFQDVVGDDAALLGSYFQVSAEGNWEGVNILNRRMSDADFAAKKELDAEEWKRKKAAALRKLQLVRSTRVKPGLDNKILTGWNAMAISGLLDAYDALGESEYLEMAIETAEFLIANAYDNGRLYRTPPTASTKIDGYLEDYAFMADAFIDLYERTFDEQWIRHARTITDYAIENFLDKEEDMFFYTDGSTHDLVVRKKEIFDNVIPSSNSEMARVLLRLGRILDHAPYTELSNLMLSRMKPMISEAITDLSHWARLHACQAYPLAEVVFVGENALAIRQGFAERYIPNKITMGTETESELPLVRGKSAYNGRTTIYVCYNKTCKLPVNEIEAAYEQLR